MLIGHTSIGISCFARYSTSLSSSILLIPCPILDAPNLIAVHILSGPAASPACMYAQNAKIKVGDTIKLAGKELKVTGFVAVPDYSCLFENNSDMMFDSTNFSIAVMTDKGFEKVSSNHVKYNYAWKYNKEVSGDKAEKEASDDYLENLGDVIKEYDTELIMSGNTDIISVSDYLPRYTNKAVNFTDRAPASPEHLVLPE